MRRSHDVRLTAMVQSGLGNRVRVVCGALSLAHSWGLQEIDVHWPTSKTFGPQLADLWDLPAKPISSSRAQFRRLLGRTYDENVRHLGSAERRFTTIRTQHALALPEHCEEWGAQLRAATPHPRIADNVRDIWARERLMESPYVGVMIRSTAAHTKTLESSPLAWYVEVCQQLQRVSGIERFFLSTDTSEMADAFISHFPNTALIEQKGPYNSTTGVQDAICDLYLLASSSLILGPYWSSFVTMAERLAPDVRSINSRTVAQGLDQLDLVSAAQDPLSPWTR